ncbi:MAG: WecB/TagA/CpsF family glycosyltransferase [Treponema sp.]|nr:WecB/TagA/CpsF family glycosyltransferase [Treponema sp.]
MAVQRIDLLGVPVDVCQPEELESEILEMLAKPGTKQIVFLSVWKLLRARRKRGDFGSCIKSADLILPVSKSILTAAKFLKLTVPVRYNPFTATISILSVIDQHYKSLYLLGGRDKTLFRTEKNVHETFTGIQIVGRFTGYYRKQLEGDIVQSIYKSSPSLALISEGIKEQDLWSYRRRNSFSSSIFLHYKDAFGIFSDRIRRVDEKTFEKGREIWYEIVRNPLKILLAFPFFGFILITLWYRIFRKNSIAA